MPQGMLFSRNDRIHLLRYLCNALKFVAMHTAVFDLTEPLPNLRSFGFTFVSQLVSQSVSLSVCLSFCFCLFVPVYLFVCLSLCVGVPLTVCLSFLGLFLSVTNLYRKLFSTLLIFRIVGHNG